MPNLDLHKIENQLSKPICEAAIPKQYKDPIDVLNRWRYLSEQFPRFLGAILARSPLPAAQCLVAKNITGECGGGDAAAMHSKLLGELVGPVITRSRETFSESHLSRVIEQNLATIATMGEGQSIGFLIGLEAPAYEILALLRRCLLEAGVTAEAIDGSVYMATHQEVEAEHQKDSLLMAQIVAELGCDEAAILEGGHRAVEFWQAWWGAEIHAKAS
ncbi:iron-containing redox enzyme family protein [Nannocystis sp. SCPEA4]|uniref:iron-containing redox enzyme family protein n=1 Tax=Nannocystis sp. SCPEA4 TaxID=2996787 RepID=UPI00226EFB34|nr:iron-containing redox enzyme family protein [Nannocystis sp. SCPEA4]MCY1058102.1 iron-containing redox enzyme family protein [Nannocystis sp. SCPEA4]